MALVELTPEQHRQRVIDARCRAMKFPASVHARARDGTGYERPMDGPDMRIRAQTRQELAGRRIRPEIIEQETRRIAAAWAAGSVKSPTGTLVGVIRTMPDDMTPDQELAWWPMIPGHTDDDREAAFGRLLDQVAQGRRIDARTLGAAITANIAGSWTIRQLRPDFVRKFNATHPDHAPVSIAIVPGGTAIDSTMLRGGSIEFLRWVVAELIAMAELHRADRWPRSIPIEHRNAEEIRHHTIEAAMADGFTPLRAMLEQFAHLHP